MTITLTLPTVEEFITALRYEVGTVEHPDGSNCQPYSHELNRPCESWCADFLVAMSRRMGLVLPGESAYTPNLEKAYADAGRYSQTPELGAFPFYDFPDSVHRIQHVGCVTSITSSYIFDIEGNTSPSDAGSQAHGGGVWERKRPRNNSIRGYGINIFAPSHPTPNPNPPIVEELEMDFFIIRFGDQPGTGDDNPGRWAWWPEINRKTFISGDAIKQFTSNKHCGGELLILESEVRGIRDLAG